jgi:hypothetical protein
MRAVRRLGELMARQKETVGLAPAGRPKKIGLNNNPISKSAPPTLAEAGIDKNLANREIRSRTFDCEMLSLGQFIRILTNI